MFSTGVCADMHGVVVQYVRTYVVWQCCEMQYDHICLHILIYSNARPSYTVTHDCIYVVFEALSTLILLVSPTWSSAI